MPNHSLLHSPQSFSFALTLDDGFRRLGYCRRYNNGTPLCFCIISVL
jgi:hypothetical protein